MSQPLTISVASDQLQRHFCDLSDVLSAFKARQLALSEAFDEVVDGLLRRPEALIDLSAVDREAGAASRAIELHLGLKPTELMFRLLAALRTGYGDLGLIEIELRQCSLQLAALPDEPDVSRAQLSSRPGEPESPAASSSVAGEEGHP